MKIEKCFKCANPLTKMLVAVPELLYGYKAETASVCDKCRWIYEILEDEGNEN